MGCDCQGQTVLLVDAGEPVCVKIAHAIEQAGFGTTQVGGLDEAREALGTPQP